jgi:glycosyltransferase involved in cell wall biosynthesis
MIIGFDAKRAFCNTRGLGNYSRTLLSGLLRYYPNNDYYLFGNPPESDSLNEWYASVKKNATIVAPQYSSSLYNALWRSFYMRNEIMNNNIDIYHGLSHEIPGGIAKNTKTKFVVTVHDLLFLRFKSNFSLIDRHIYRAKISHSCQRAHKVIAISEQTKSDLIKYLQIPAEKIEVLYQTCSPIFYNSVADSMKSKIRKTYSLPDKYLLFVGALVKHKNIERIIEAISLLPAHCSLPLLIVGKPNSYKKQLLAKARACNVAEKIQFIDYIPDVHMPAIYQMAKILVWPSLFEGFGIPILEALFSGLPVITTRGGCFSETGGNAAFYVNPNNSEEISKALEQILSSNELYANMQKMGYQQAQKFHIENTSKSLMNLYMNL